MTLAFLFLLASACVAFAQQLPTELNPFVEKYGAEAEAINRARSAAIDLVKKPYLAALDAAELKASQSGKTDSVKAIIEEKQIVSIGEALSGTGPGALPRDLASARATYVREMSRVEQAAALRINQFTAEYLRALGAAEVRARVANNQSALNAIASEKLKVTDRSTPTAGSAAKPSGKNLLSNANFQSQLEGWHASSKVISVMNEKGESFVRFHGGGFEQSVTLPPGAKRYSASVKMRAASKLPSRHFGIVSVGQVGPEVPSQGIYNNGIPGSTWRTYEVEGKIAPKAQGIRLAFWGFLEGAIDVKDCLLEVR